MMLLMLLLYTLLMLMSIFVTQPEKTGLFYTKYTCSYYSTCLLFYMCYPESVIFIEFLMDFCIYDGNLGTLLSTDKSL